jgi:SRSO17 transposase
MTPEEMDRVRPRIEAFAAEMLGGLGRADQRAKGALYLRGLLLDGKRKSMRPMTARLESTVCADSIANSNVARRVERWVVPTGRTAGHDRRWLAC